MDYNATTPLAPEVIETVKGAMYEAWGNPSSSYEAGLMKIIWKCFVKASFWVQSCLVVNNGSNLEGLLE